MTRKAQSALEYLLLIGGALTIAIVVIVAIPAISGDAHKSAAKGAYNTLDLTDTTLVAHYNFDEGSGTLAIDSSLNQLNGVYKRAGGAGAPPSTQWVSGKNGSAFHFQQGVAGIGPAYYIEVPQSKKLDLGPSAFSIAFWIKLEDNATPIDAVISKGDIINNNFNRNFAIIRYDKDVQTGSNLTSNQLQFFIYGGTSAQSALWPTVPQPNAWEYRAIVFKPTGTPNEYAMGLYTNGVLESTVTKTFVFNTFPGKMLIGTYSTVFASDPYRSLHGYLDDLRIYNRALTAAEVNKLYTTFK